MNVYWCLTHNANAEGSVARCWYALYTDALERCSLADAEVKLTDDPEPKYETEPLPTVEEWINTHGPW